MFVFDKQTKSKWKNIFWACGVGRAEKIYEEANAKIEAKKKGGGDSQKHRVRGGEGRIRPMI